MALAAIPILTHFAGGDVHNCQDPGLLRGAFVLVLSIRLCALSTLLLAIRFYACCSQKWALGFLIAADTVAACGPPPTPLAGPASGGGGRWRGAGVRAEGGPGTTTEAMAAAGVGAPDVGADTPPLQPAPAGRGAGGIAVVPGGPGATEAVAAAGDRGGATDVAGVETPPGPRPLPAG
jgi:hypothetical protein